MKIQELKVSDLIPYVRNNKKHTDDQIDLVAASIKKFGFNQPIVVDKDLIVVAGHCRLYAAQKLKMKTVPAVIISEKLSIEDINAYRIVDNSSNQQNWDWENLRLEIEELERLNFDIGEFRLDELLLVDDDEIEFSDKEPSLKISENGIIIDCENEQEQERLFEEFKERGLKCKLL